MITVKELLLQYKKIFIGLFLLCFLFSFFLFQNVFAAAGIYQTINFQGKLVNPSTNINIADGTYTIVFTLYDASSGGSQLWQESKSVTVADGVFMVTLGTGTSLSTVDFNSDSIYLGIKVESNAEMTPRVRFTAVPYAFESKRVGGLTVTNNGGNTLNIAANKTFIVSNSLTLAGTDSTTFTFPSSSGTVVTLDATQTLTNKTLTDSTSFFQDESDNTKKLQFQLSGISTGTTRTLTIPDASGTICLSGGSCSASAVPLSGITAATTTNTIDSTNNAQTWNWSTLSTETALTSNANAITSGSILNLSSSSTGFTGTMASINLTGSNAANSGTLLKVSNTGTLNTGTPLIVTNLGTGFSFRVNDETGDGDTTPFVVDASGNVGIGTTNPSSKLQVAATGASLTLGDGTNTSTSINIASNRTMLGYDGSNAVFQGGTSKGIKFNVNNSSFGSGTAMVIDSTGNVGIGTTAPASLLSAGSTSQFQVNSSGNIVKVNNIDYSWPSSQAAASGYVLSNNGSGTLTWVAPSVTANSLDYTDFKDTMALDANLTLNQTTNTWSQTFTGTTTTGYTYTANSLTSGKALSITSSATGFTGTLADISLTGNNSANSGTLLKVSSTGTSNTGTPLMVTNLGAGNSFRVNDETGDGDTTPFLIDASGNVSIGSATTTLAKLYVAVNDGNGVGIHSSQGITGSSTTSLYGMKFDALHGSSGTVGFAYGARGGLYFNSSGGASNSAGGLFEVQLGSTAPSWLTTYGLIGSGASYITTTASGVVGIQGIVANQATGGTLANATAMEIANLTNNGVITNTYGLYIGDLSTGNQTNTPYSIYASDANTRNYFAGNVGIGIATNTSGYKLHVAEGNALVAQSTTSSLITIESSATGAAYDARSLHLISGSNTTGHAYTEFRAGTSRAWSFGMDRADSDKLKISVGTSFATPGTGDLLVITTAGNIGVGTTTPATGKKLDVQGELQINFPTTGATTIGVCKSAADGTAADQNLVECSTTPGDIAEWYETESGIEAGDIVMPSNNIFTYQEEQFDPKTGLSKNTTVTNSHAILKKTTTSYQQNIFGIVSTSPYQVYGEAVVKAGAVNPQPIALNGRVHVKISSSSQSIQPGDFITTSTEAGKGMKATKAGYMVGRALDSWTPSSGKSTVMIYVNNTYADPESILSNITLNSDGEVIIPEYETSISSLNTNVLGLTTIQTAQTSSLNSLQNEVASISASLLTLNTKVDNHAQTLTDIVSRLDYIQPNATTGGKLNQLEDRINFLENAVLASGSGSLATNAGELVYQNNEATISGLLVTGKSNLNDLTVIGTMKVGLIATDGLNASVDALGTNLKLQSSMSGGIELVGNKVEIDTSGNIKIKEGDITVEKGVIKGNDNMRGSVTVSSGQSSITITGKTWTTAPTTITANASYDSYVWITNITATGFTINVKNAPSSDEKIYWQALW